MYRSHVLVCGGTGCTSSNSQAISDTLKKEIAANDLTDEVKVVRISPKSFPSTCSRAAS